MAHVLITGGAGFLGINLIRYLIGKGHKITCLDKADFVWGDESQVRIIKGDIRVTHTVRDAMQGVDYAVHCAAALPLEPRETIFSTQIKGTENVMREALAAGVKRVVHISTTAVYGIPDHHPLYETDPLQGVGNYGQAKIVAEKVALSYREKGLCVPILRPKTFVGKERLGVFAIYFEWIMEGRNIPLIGKGNNKYQLLDVEDLCEAIYLCLAKERSKVNDTFNVGAKEFGTMKEDFGALLEPLGKGQRAVGLPAKPTITFLRLLEKFKLSPLYKWVYETAPHDSFVSIKKIEEQLGFTPKYSNKEALKRSYQWYTENYKNFQKTGTTHRAPWKQGALNLVKKFF